MTDPREAIDSCFELELHTLNGCPGNGLRLIAVELIPDSVATSLPVGETVIEGLHRLRETDASRRFKLVWERYVAYAVLNESYAIPDGPEEVRISGKLFRSYSRSRFLDYVARGTWANGEYPGPLLHHCLVCGDHVVHVASTHPPEIAVSGRGRFLRPN